ncbi:MAG: hypothetical protein ABSH50_04235 [Bryobacteraceae bacterium]
MLLAATAPHAGAQVKVGDLSTDLSGTLSGGYTADYGNLTASDHGITAGGTASLSGSYYNPNFFSFTVQPFYNQSRTNSDFQSITDASGVNATASIFSGSNFPGSISFADLSNGQGNFGVPGVANYTSHGDSQVFSLGWNEHVPNIPTLSIGYQQGNTAYSIYGANTNSTSDFRSFVVSSSYSLLGFNLNGSYHYSDTQSQLPQIFSSEVPGKSDSDTTSYAFGLGHALPFHGNFSSGATRSDLDYTSSEGQYDGTLDTAYAGMTFNPVERLTFGANAQYLDNLTGELYQSIIAAGGIATENLPIESSHALDLTGFASYMVPALHMTFDGTEQRQEQRFAGQTFDSDSLTGTATYGNFLLGGMFNATVGAVRSSISSIGGSRVGFIGSGNYTREVGRWSFSTLANYAQDQQTLLASYLTSSFGYSGNLSRRFAHRSSWSATASGSKTGLLDQSGSSSFSQSYATSLFLKWFTGSATYSRASGNAILTGSGLVATPIPLPVVTPAAVVLYGGHAYSFGAGATPLRGLSLSLSYSQAISSTANSTLDSNNSTSQLTARILYIVRKVYFQAGYARLVQDFSASGSRPSMLGSFYFGVTRWFSFF